MRDLFSDLNNYAWPQTGNMCVRYGKRFQRSIWHQLAVASSEFYI